MILYLVSGKDFLQQHFEAFKEFPLIQSLFESIEDAKNEIKSLGTITNGGPWTITKITLEDVTTK
jgi:hypothetical protein